MSGQQQNNESLPLIKKPTSRGSHMLQKRRAETALINIISTIIFDDDKCHHYARQFVEIDIRTKGNSNITLLIFFIYIFFDIFQ